MQQIRERALACYDNFSDEQKEKAYAVFEVMDSDGDGTVTLDEYEEFCGSSDRSFFQQLDADGDGKLDFHEFIPLFYVFMSSKGTSLLKDQPKSSGSNQPMSSHSNNQLTGSGRSRTELLLKAFGAFSDACKLGSVIAGSPLCTIM